MHLFTKYLSFRLTCWTVFFISLAIKILFPLNSQVNQTSSASKKTYIASKIFVSTAISMIVIVFLIIIKFDLGTIFKQ